jgi:GNAT superfamily N-acetyltransferase
MTFTHRLATRADLPALTSLVDVSISELQKPFLNDKQIEASRMIMGLDSQLIEDGTYFIVEEASVLAGCGGWSRRTAMYGGDHTGGRDSALLDPSEDAARMRAVYTHPTFARRGVGRLVLELCEGAARAAGFSRAELVATMAGAPLFSACGYKIIDDYIVDEVGPLVPLLLMEKAL